MIFTKRNRNVEETSVQLLTRKLRSDIAVTGLIMLNNTYMLHYRVNWMMTKYFIHNMELF